MAKKEGYCSQCGSLINVDDKKEKVNCIFCGEEVDVSKALELSDDEETRLLLQKAAEEKAKKEAAELKEKLKNAKPIPKAVAKDKSDSPREEVVLKPLPKRTKIAIIAGSIGFVILILAIFVPLLTVRNANREAMDKLMENEFNIEITSHSYKYNDNRELIIATEDEITKDDALNVYHNYLRIYANTYDVTTDKAQNKITVIIYSYGEDGGKYTYTYADGEVKADFETGHPIHTPTTEQTITD